VREKGKSDTRTGDDLIELTCLDSGGSKRKKTGLEGVTDEKDCTWGWAKKQRRRKPPGG